MTYKPPVDDESDKTEVRAPVKAVIPPAKTPLDGDATGGDHASEIPVDHAAEVIAQGDEPTVTIENSDATLLAVQNDDAAQDDDATVLTSLDATVITQRPLEEGGFNTENSQGFTQTRNPLTNTLHRPFTLGGEVIKDRFIIEKVLGKGGMGMVCRALDLRRVEADDEQPHIAIKLLTSDFQQHASAFKSLQREAKKTQALAHPNIITVYDFDRDGDTIFMTMEELDGYPLDAIIKGNTEIVVDKKTALKIVREIASALEYAHSKGIIHSDLKPGNIFYTHTGQTKVLDFGIARALNTELYQDNFDAGELGALTPKYASLEMIERQDPDPRDDIYALGIIAGELLCGYHPYQGKTAVEVRDHGIKPKLEKSLGFLYKKTLRKSLAVQREARTPTASEFLSSLNWAEKGPRRLLLASIVVVVLAVANAFLIDAVDDEIPLSELSQADQTLVVNNLKEAEIALKFKDYNGALVYLDRAYQIHPTNDDIEDHADSILDDFSKNINNVVDKSKVNFLVSQLEEMGRYGFIASNDNYKNLHEKFQ